jgi:putative (di)nucleoside polyphosphate hydrolase
VEHVGEIAVTSGGDHEVFRAGVGVLVVNEVRQVLALERRDSPNAWQLPQGGLHSREDITAAAWRELKEETGLGEEQVWLRAITDLWVGYELPEGMRSAKTGRGQVHKWCLFELKPQTSPSPPLPRHRQAEFVASKWISLQELATQAIDFRKPIYEYLEGWLSSWRSTAPWRM